ncbi:LTA synthase family protein [Flavobacterium sp.]|uniref:LTA synthase family protein n=1 Tax=Flavobacterium sp. TaxID=239 RepID=UPI0035B1ACE3
MQLLKKSSPVTYLLSFYLIVSIVLRVVLLFHPITQSTFSAIEILKIFSFGLLSDLFVFVIVAVFLNLYLVFLSNTKYNKPWGYVIFGFLVLLLLYVSFGNTILNEYGGSLPEVGIIFISIKTLFFGLMLFLPNKRSLIRSILYFLTIFLYVLLIIQNAVSEYFFWNEFGVRYNFIAVDYLVYTNTVIGNIMESYPVVPLFITEGIIAVLITFFIVRKTKPFLLKFDSFQVKLIKSIAYVGLFFISMKVIPFLAKKECSSNVYTNELQSNGIFKFYTAFMNNELDYDKYYKTIDTKLAFSTLSRQYNYNLNNSTLRKIASDSSEIHKNIVLITIESLSADFLKAYGGKKDATPFLDSLATKSLQFTNLYATGNRTVRGLEAVTLSLPPSAAESVVKRKDNKNKFSTGYVLKQKGYQVKYLYGGDAYFDNMQDFFGGNGYEIVDKKSFKPNEITFSNIWGVCDEDMYKKAIKVMNEEAKNKKPFFNHIMSVSNHRPFTYPDGKIDIPSNKKSRIGGVKYTDYALKQFFEMAKTQSWYSNTVFVIVADHCASSSGKTELPLDKYRIPGMIFSPNFIKPQEFNTLMSQIDVMPTLFGLLKMNYFSKFYGQNVLDADYKPRAFIATYQDLGLIKDNVLTIISPVKKVKQYNLKLKPDNSLKYNFQIKYDEVLMPKLDEKLVEETISYYQTSAWLLKNKKLNQ